MVAPLWVPIIRSWALTRGYALHPGTRNRHEIRYTRTQHRPASQHVNDHGRVSGTHRAVGSNRSTCRRSTASWWRNTMISRSFERRERTARRTSATNKRDLMRCTRTQHRPAFGAGQRRLRSPPSPPSGRLSHTDWVLISAEPLRPASVSLPSVLSQVCSSRTELDASLWSSVRMQLRHRRGPQH